MIVPPTKESLTKAAEIIRSGGTVSFPTETVYGLGADATNDLAVKQIFAIKGRPSSDPLIVHLAAPSQVESVAEISGRAESAKRLQKLSSFWPGPLSIVLPKKDVIPDSVSAGLKTVAVRVPNHAVALELIRISGKPIAAPSANPFGYVSPTTAQHVADSFGDKIELIIDGGECSIGLESTVLSLCEGVPTILRPGAITKEMIEQCLAEPVEIKTEALNLNQNAPAPGMLFQHYSPRTPIAWLTERNSDSLPERFGVIRFSSKTAPLPANPTAQLLLSEQGSLEAVANRLFSALRELDAKNLELILIDSCLEQGIGVAIMDRVKRAIGRK